MFASTVLMCRSASFGFNNQTGQSNAFQQDISIQNSNEKARQEFDDFVFLLRNNHIDVEVVEDTIHPIKPDAIFPNNWFSTHADSRIFIYPMLTENRKAEVRADIIAHLQNKYAYKEVVDLRNFNDGNLILEGTGSIVFDHHKKKVFAALSPRTNIELVKHISVLLGYKVITFQTHDKNGDAIYHTNVIMCVGEEFCVACIDGIVEKDLFLEEIKDSGLELISISLNEMESFAGNMLMLRNKSGENILVMSDTAFRSLPKNKLEQLSKYARILHPSIPTIETLGGGSVRCMMAELFTVNVL
jgi:hypothetical protein